MGDKKTISWQVLQSGQLRPYADSVYEYEIESDIHENQIKKFCFGFLERVNPDHKGNDFSGSCNFPYGLSPYYAFRKVADNKYNYKICRPYTG